MEEVKFEAEQMFKFWCFLFLFFLALGFIKKGGW